jgi:3-methyladenine DNA glycosylase AlkD
MDPIIAGIRQELQDSADPQARMSFQRFFKEAIQCYGVKVPTVSKIAGNSWKKISSRDKQEIFLLCEELYASNYAEEAFIVSNWVPRLKERFTEDDFSLFAHWIETYISNWATCDSFCNHALGDFIEMYPEFIEELKQWTRSENRWVRRAAAVSLIIPAKQGKFPDAVIAIADLLLTDNDDMVQKGYGWLLKEASRKHQEIIFDYVMKNRQVMPRTALRYAIELMPKDLKTKAMAKDLPRSSKKGRF